MSDVVSDLLTSVRNAVRLKRQYVELRSSRFTESIVDALKRAGFIWDYSIETVGIVKRMRLVLKYSVNGDAVIGNIDRVSAPGRRVYSPVNSMPVVRQGLGISLVSTSKGVLSNSEAKLQAVGGEVICSVY